ncbi:MAG TPA: alpha/beta hydrolase [Patescibacteria group bacterium]|nr:alpha/beta hydrolase [Patescibacteria group bacterium]
MTLHAHDNHAFGHDGTLHAVRMGDPRARPLIFLHGITGSRRYWEKRVAQLARRYRIIIPDLLGFGLSPKPPVDYTIPRFRASLRAFLEKEGIAGRKHVLVGHSLGALISIDYAIEHSEDVEALVLINLPRFQSAEEAHRLFWLGSPSYRKLLNESSLSENISQIRRSGVDLFIKYMVRFPWGVLADCRKFTMRSLTSTLEHCLLNYRVDESLTKLASRPVLLIHGVRDGVAPYSNIEDLPKIYPFMRVEAIPSSGHHVFLTHTRRCLRTIEDFLEKSVSKAGPAGHDGRNDMSLPGGQVEPTIDNAEGSR